MASNEPLEDRATYARPLDPVLDAQRADAVLADDLAFFKEYAKHELPGLGDLSIRTNAISNRRTVLDGTGTPIATFWSEDARLCVSIDTQDRALVATLQDAVAILEYGSTKAGTVGYPTMVSTSFHPSK